jgi:hypothetical protein
MSPSNPNPKPNAERKAAAARTKKPEEEFDFVKNKANVLLVCLASSVTHELSGPA